MPGRGKDWGAGSPAVPWPRSAPVPVSESLPGACGVCVCVRVCRRRGEEGGSGVVVVAAGGRGMIIGNGRERKRRLLFPFLSASAISAHFL